MLDIGGSGPPIFGQKVVWWGVYVAPRHFVLAVMRHYSVRYEIMRRMVGRQVVDFLFPNVAHSDNFLKMGVQLLFLYSCGAKPFSELPFYGFLL